MLAEILIFLFLGIIFGTITGLVPGIHINLVGVAIVALSASILGWLDPIYFVVFVSSMAIAHTFIDFIPSIFLGCPDTETELSVLPGHELLKQGKGYEAIALATYGSFAAIFMVSILTIPALYFVPKAYDFLLKKIELTPNIEISIMPLILILVFFVMVYLESNKFQAVFVFLVSGILGITVLNLETLKEPLLPLLSGLFGSSMLILSIKENTKIPPQEISKPKLTKKNFWSPLFGVFIASPLSSMLPGLGSGQAAVIGNIFSRTDRKGFLVLVGATNTLVMGFSFITLYLASKTRSGAAVAINELVGVFSWQVLVLIMATIIISGIICFFETLFLGKFFSQKMPEINYKKASIITLSILSMLVLLVSGFFGLIVLAVSTITGLYCINLKVRRTHMMGCLLLPTIIFYLF